MKITPLIQVYYTKKQIKTHRSDHKAHEGRSAIFKAESRDMCIRETSSDRVFRLNRRCALVCKFEVVASFQINIELRKIESRYRLVYGDLDWEYLEGMCFPMVLE